MQALLELLTELCFQKLKERNLSNPHLQPNKKTQKIMGSSKDPSVDEIDLVDQGFIGFI